MNPGGSNPYDTAGNMTSWNGANGYSYGPFNETWRVVTSNQEWVHVYTADDERLFSYEVGGGQLRRWALRGLDNRVLREYTFVQEAPSGVIERDNIYRGSGPLLAAATPAGDRHYHVDHLGTPRQITDATGAQVAFHTYYPYGEEATSPTQDTARFKFTGHERDLADPTDTQDDLDHMHARMTNPKLGRFLSVDPAMESARSKSPQSWNRYAYAAGNPLRRVDPDGRNWFHVDGWDWQWHEGAEWADKNGKKYTSSYTHLLTFTKTGTNSLGATTGTLVLYEQNKVLGSSAAFSGGNGFPSIPNGTFTIRLDIRGQANSSAALKENQLELKQFYGIQEIAPWITDNTGQVGSHRWEWGSIRAALNEEPGETRLLFRGNYLHGKERPGDYTHGCICDRSESILRLLNGLDPTSVPSIPVGVQ